MAILEPPAAQRIGHRLHHGVMADEQDGRSLVPARANRQRSAGRAGRWPARLRRPAAGSRRDLRSVLRSCVFITSAIFLPSRLPKSHSMMPRSIAIRLPREAAMISAVCDGADERDCSRRDRTAHSAADRRPRGPAPRRLRSADYRSVPGSVLAGSSQWRRGGGRGTTAAAPAAFISICSRISSRRPRSPW